MKRKWFVTIISILVLTFGINGFAWAQNPDPGSALGSLGTAFTYQGQLKNASGPVTGSCDFQFGLWDSLTTGTQVGSTLTKTNLQVSQGLFTVQLDFGVNAFNGSARWLEIWVGCPTAAVPAKLAPRQALTPAPYAVYASQAGGVPWSGVTGTPLQLPTGCSNENIPQWNGSAWTCAEDDDVAYSAGTGLILSGAKFNVDINAIQVRVSSTCVGGSTISAILSDGSVQCQPRFLPNRLTPPAINSALTLTVPSVSYAGKTTSIAIGADRLPVISHSSSGGVDLTHCQDLNCLTQTTILLDFGDYSSLAIGADGLPIISYINANHLTVAHCSDVACSASVKHTLDPSDSAMVQPTSIAIGADGLPVIAFGTYTGNGDLKVAHCSDITCASATINPLMTGFNGTSAYQSPGYAPAISIGADGLPIVVSYDYGSTYTCSFGCYWASYYNLSVTHCSNNACSTVNNTNLVEETGTVSGTTITIGVDGLPVISYYQGSTVKVLHCPAQDCSSGGTNTTLDTAGQAPAITIGTDGLPVISYYDSTNHMLKVAHCGGLDCSAHTTITADSTANTGQYSSIAVGADTLPIISYFGSTSNALEVLHCASTFCASGFKWR